MTFENNVGCVLGKAARNAFRVVFCRVVILIHPSHPSFVSSGIVMVHQSDTHAESMVSALLNYYLEKWQ